MLALRRESPDFFVRTVLVAFCETVSKSSSWLESLSGWFWAAGWGPFRDGFGLLLGWCQGPKWLGPWDFGPPILVAAFWGLILYFVFGPSAMTQSLRAIMQSMKGIMQSMNGLMMGLIILLLDSKWFGYFYGGLGYRKTNTCFVHQANNGRSMSRRPFPT